MEEKGFFDRAINKILSMKTTTIYLILLVFLGFILRLIAAINLSVTADDMHFVTHAINFLSAGRLETYDQSSGLWFAFTSLMYKFFGISQISSRMAALIFGTFSILLIYLLSREFFNEKVSLIAAFLLAVAPFHIRNTVAEMDVFAMFFVLGAMLFFIKGLKARRGILFAISGTFMGLAIYSKVYPLLFIPSLLLFFAYNEKKEKRNIFRKKNFYLVLAFLIPIFVFSIPALTHNYLLYKDKGFMDLQFTRTLGLGQNISAQYYSWDPIWGRTNSWKGLIFGDTNHGPAGFPLILYAPSFILFGDPIVFILGILGLLFIFFKYKAHRDYLYFFLLSIAFILPFLASIILLTKHFLFLELLLITPASLLLSKLINRKNAKIILLVVFIFSLIVLGVPKAGTNPFYSKSHVSQMIDFKEASIPESALIIGDNRIYTGRTNWAFQERSFIDALNFIHLSNGQNELPGQTVNMEVYAFECALDDCGWGTIKDNKDLNTSMEAFFDSVKDNGELVKTISEPVKGKSYYPILGEKEEVINVYRMVLPLKTSIYQYGAQPKSWFLYTTGYEGEQFDSYVIYNALDSMIEKLAHLIVYIALILTFLSPLYVFYLVYKDRENEVINNNTGL